MRKHLSSVKRIIIAGAIACAACSRSQDAQSRANDADSVSAKPPAALETSVSGDSLRGTLALDGTSAASELTLHAGDSVYVLRATQPETMRRVAGLEIVVTGRRDGGVFEVARFAVRSANGEPAVDGIMDVENGVFFLRLADGKRATIAKPPIPLRGEIGSRVYLVGSLSGPISAFGIISEQ